MFVYGFKSDFNEPDAKYVTKFERPQPTLRPKDLLIQVEAVSVNPVDTKVRMFGDIPKDAPRVLGYDAVGTVKKIGDEAEGFAIGDHVFYAGQIDRPGSFSEYHGVDARLVARAPTSISALDAASLPLTSLTAWELLFLRFGLEPSNKTQGTLLIIGGAGGVGSILIQLARRMTGLTVIATASRPQSVDWCLSLGAHHTINHHAPLARQLTEIGYGNVDMAASLTHTDSHFEAIVDVIKPGGRLGVIDDPKTLDATRLKSKSISLHWELMFTRSLFQTEDMSEQGTILNAVGQMVEAGELRPTAVTRYTKLTEDAINDALIAQASGATIGKTVLEMASK